MKEKIRGLRQNIVMCDDFHEYDEEKLKLIKEGFAAVTFDPIKHIKETKCPVEEQKE